MIFNELNECQAAERNQATAAVHRKRNVIYYI